LELFEDEIEDKKEPVMMKTKQDMKNQLALALVMSEQFADCTITDASPTEFDVTTSDGRVYRIKISIPRNK